MLDTAMITLFRFLYFSSSSLHSFCPVSRGTCPTRHTRWARARARAEDHVVRCVVVPVVTQLSYPLLMVSARVHRCRRRYELIVWSGARVFEQTPPPFSRTVP